MIMQGTTLTGELRRHSYLPFITVLNEGDLVAGPALAPLDAAMLSLIGPATQQHRHS